MRELSKWTAKRISGLFTVNLGLKVIALISASLLWLLVVNLDDPKQSRNFTATVNVIDEDVLTDAGKYYELPNGNTVTFRVTARRSVIESLTSSDFIAIADMNYLEDDTRVPIEISPKRDSNQISISSKTHYLMVSVGENIESTFMVHAAATGDPGDGFEVGEVTVTPNVLTVYGPSEVVSSIDKVTVAVDAGGRIEDFTITGVPKFYDSEGQEIDTTSLTLSSDSVEVFVDLLSVQEVGIEVETSGSLREGLELGDIRTDPERVLLRGQAEILNNLSVLTIPPGVVNLSEIKDDFETTIDISSYLPEGVSMAKNSSSQVRVIVSIISEDSVSYGISTSNLTIQNLSPGLTGRFKDKTVEVAIDGLESMLSELDAKSITGSVDASGLSAGTHSVAVTLDLDEGLEARTATTDIIISALGKPVEGGNNDISDGTVIDSKEKNKENKENKDSKEKNIDNSRYNNTDEDTGPIRYNDTEDTVESDVNPGREADTQSAPEIQTDDNVQEPPADNGQIDQQMNDNTDSQQEPL